MCVPDGSTAEVGDDGDGVAGEFIVDDFDDLVIGYTHDPSQYQIWYGADEFVDEGSHRGKGLGCGGMGSELNFDGGWKLRNYLEIIILIIGEIEKSEPWRSKNSR